MYQGIFQVHVMIMWYYKIWHHQKTNQEVFPRLSSVSYSTRTAIYRVSSICTLKKKVRGRTHHFEQCTWRTSRAKSGTPQQTRWRLRRALETKENRRHLLHWNRLWLRRNVVSVVSLRSFTKTWKRYARQSIRN